MRISLFCSALLLIGGANAFAHLGYGGRDFGIFGLEPRTFTITGQATRAFGWADGTDADWAKQDDQRYFRFTLESSASITISVTSLDAALFLPGLSLYSGLGHSVTDSANPDHDGAPITRAYLLSLGAPTREGAFDALHTWKIANDPSTSFADLVTFTYIGNAADGTSANYGSAEGINGDGVADGFVTSTFDLPAGDYTLVIAGADYFSTDVTPRNFDVSVSNVPEPSSAILVATGLAAVGLVRRRSAVPVSV